MKTLGQREMPFYKALEAPKFAQKYVIESFTCYRDAVIWCWEHRVNTGAGEKVDQMLCANFLGLHASHLSRCLNRDTQAPMNLNPDVYSDFEAFCGWRAISQFLAGKAQMTFMEEAQEMMRSRSGGVAACA
jgi:hypothetical protein